METPFLVLRDPSPGPFADPGAVTRIPLPHVLDMARAADALMRAAMGGDAKAKEGVETVFRTAMTPGPDQGISIVFAYLLRDTLHQVLREREKAPTQVIETVSEVADVKPANDRACRRGHAPDAVCVLCAPRVQEPDRVRVVF